MKRQERNELGRFTGEFESEIAAAVRMRREAELALLDRLRAEAAMPEWYPER